MAGGEKPAEDGGTSQRQELSGGFHPLEAGGDAVSVSSEAKT